MMKWSIALLVVACMVVDVVEHAVQGVEVVDVEQEVDVALELAVEAVEEAAVVDVEDVDKHPVINAS